MRQTGLAPEFERSIPALGFGFAFIFWFINSLIVGLIPQQASISFLLMTIVALIVALLNFRIWMGGLVLFVLIGHQFVSERPHFDDRLHLFVICWRVILDLAFLVISARLNVLGKQLGLNWTNRRQIASRLQQLFECGSSGHGDSAMSIMSRWWVIARRRILLPVLIGLALMVIIPLEPGTISEYRLTPGGFRAIQLGILLAMLFLVMGTILNALTWRQLSSAQSWIYLRSVTMSWLRPELRAIVKRRMKWRKTSQRHRDATERHKKDFGDQSLEGE